MSPTQETQKRMILSAIGTQKHILAEKIVLYGPEGVGKSTWAAHAEKPVFISTERGLKGVSPAPQSFPEAQTWGDVLEAVETLTKEDHDYRTLVVDTADWTEALCQKMLCDRDSKNSIEAYGYGKGYVMASEEWRKLIACLNRLQEAKLMTAIVLAHSSVATFNNPAGDNYDRYQMKLDKRSYPVLKEWADALLFANHKVVVDMKDGAQKGKGLGGSPHIFSTYSPAWDAKNRYGITEPIPMTKEEGFSNFWKYVEEWRKNQ